MLPPSELTWDLVEPSLLALASADLDAGRPPAPTLIAFAGDEPQAVAALRPFGPGELVPALVELLALFLPLGSDRLALSLPGHAWPLDECAAAAEPTGADPRVRVVAVSLADGRVRPARLVASLHAYRVDADGWSWGERLAPPESSPEGEIPQTLTAILDARDDLTVPRPLELVAQLGRVLLLGHELALAPEASVRLEQAAGSHQT